MHPLYIVCFFTALIHLTETLASSMRLAWVRTVQVATSLSFVNASLLISRMSNMLQAPLLGSMVDFAILNNNTASLFGNFRISPISWLTLEGEVQGIAKGKPRWDWLNEEAVYHAGVSFEVFSNFYLSGFVFDILGRAERRLGLTYVFSTGKK